MQRILITGGAGFVGSSLARMFRAHDVQCEVVAFDNLRRRGSELNLPLLARAGVKFVHGDVRVPADLAALAGTFDLIVDAAADPSVRAGMTGSPLDVLEPNLGGTGHLLELARVRGGGLIFLSTSRVYGIPALRGIPLVEGPTRLSPDATKLPEGLTPAGITEEFSTAAPRSYYGTSKLGSELLVEEYLHSSGVKAFINRCGVIMGQGQFGKADQGVFTLWVAHHAFGKPLKYTGFGGTGKQVRDLMHPRDLFALIQLQREAMHRDDVSRTFNVGGGVHSVSLLEMTALCRAATGNEVPIAQDPTTHPVDVPWYVTDHSRVTSSLGWRPTVTTREMVEEVAAWVKEERVKLEGVLG